VKEGKMNDDPLTLELLQQYKPLVKKKAAAYFLIGGDRDDLIQEGMIGLYKAIRDYDPDKGNPFHSFALLCVNRQIISAVKASARQKHIPLNTSLSLNNPDEKNEPKNQYAPNPESLVIGRETYHDIESFLQKHLSELEYTVLMLHLEGRSHSETAGELGRNVKTIDNTLQRIRRKVGKILSQQF
jgi:RNA polymerase sporulation-specific sigma factor